MKVAELLETADALHADDRSGEGALLYSPEEGPFEGVHTLAAYRAYFEADPTGDLADQKEAGTEFEDWMGELRHFDLVRDADDRAEVSPAGGLDALEADARAGVEAQASETRADMERPSR